MKLFFSSRSKFFSFALAVVFVLLLIFLNSQGLLKSPEAVVYKIFFPVQKFFYRVSGESLNYFSALFSLGKLVNQNQELREDNLKFQSEIIFFQEQSRENEVLRRQLNADLPKKFQFILANVVGRCADNFNQCLFIDQGQKGGVGVGSAVTLAGGILVGKVVEVNRDSSKVILLSDPTSVVNVLTQRTRISGVLKGDRGMGLILDMMPQDSRIETGEPVITAGFESGFPRGLLVGEVETIISFDVEAFKRAKVRSMVESCNVETLFVAIN